MNLEERTGVKAPGDSGLKSSQQPAPKPSKRTATVYDGVAGRVGVNGFLTSFQTESTSVTPLAPQEVLLRRVNAPHQIQTELYEADNQLAEGTMLPESELLKSLHTYASEFYSRSTRSNGRYDFRSLDETALLAWGILLEEACSEVLGKEGDMVLVEPAGLEMGLPESSITKHQIKGRVKPPSTPDLDKDEAEESDEPVDEHRHDAKKRRRS